MNSASKSWLALSIALMVMVPLWIGGAAGETALATYSRGVVHVTIPYRAPHAGAGRLTMEVLDAEDEVVGRAEQMVEAGNGSGQWQQEIRLAKAVPVEDLVWHRVRYRFVYNQERDAAVEGTESISQILRTPVLHILGQQSYLAGGQAAVRVIVSDAKNEPIAGVSAVRIELDGKPLYEGRLNRRGTAEAQFRPPAGIVGSHKLKYTVDTPIGSTEFTQAVNVEDKASILLTTEKPIYQPGQTIHVRALALDRANHAAAAERKLTFEVEDAKGNKVFKKAVQTDRFGIASAEFGLADEVNLGTYHLRALMEGNNAEVALNVERYVLPKFKVALDFANQDGKARHGYRPGDHVTGIVRANYFFGKPVDGGEITVKASGMDVALFEAGKAEGKTDAAGEYRFDMTLPRYFAGRPLSQGAARVLVEATVKDSAGHAETRGEPITVSESPLLLTAVPEGGTLIPGLENQVFLLTSYADGKPASAQVKVKAAGNADQAVTTDAGGVAVIRLKGAVNLPALDVEAADKEGNRTKCAVPVAVRGGAEQILLRTERAVYRAGERIQLRVFSTRERGAAYVDVVREGQTVMTRDVDLVNGQAELALTATPAMAGALDFNAYLFGRDAVPVADHRLVFVQPADELKIEATADAAVYRPGDDARVRFRVTNARGEGVQAALGLQVVDEAVFALAEKQPGFAKVFFYLEQEALKPRYEIHSIGMTEAVKTVPEPQAEQHNRAARALFAATEMALGNRFETELGRTIPAARRWEYAGRYQARLIARLEQLSASLSHAYAQNGGDLTKASGRELRDAWDSKLRIEHVAWNPQQYLVRSAGPDKEFGNGDDLATYVEVHARKPAGRASAGRSAIDVHLEHDRGAFNGRAEMTGTVMDQQGGALEGAIVTARQIATGTTRTARADANGRFTFAAVTAGEYQVEVSAGAEKVSKNVTLSVRDRAVLNAMLRQQDAGTVVVLAPRRIAVGGNVRFAMAQMQAGQQGIVGGVPGGVLGGIIAGTGGGGAAFPMAAPAKQFDAGALKEMSLDSATVFKAVKKDGGEPGARVRSYFPEALYINPEIVTDRNGTATIAIPLADSITTWRMAMVASTPNGALGSATSSVKVFQDFFVDLDLPVTLTQGDRVTIPVAVYNYSGTKGDVGLELKAGDWYSLVEDAAGKNVAVESGRVGAAGFTIEARRIGKFKLTLAARMNGGGNRADIVVREIEVIPNGREQNVVFNGRLESTVEHAVNFPAGAVLDASKIFVRLYPGPLSQVVEGMDAILRMPGGCFEQTSSSTYPNVLALDYMKRTRKLTPEVHAKAEGYIANGYQRLLTFEVPGGGFSWFGQAPANKILTSYGLMEFSDMSKVHDVDPKVIQRTQVWLAGQQQADGSWKPDTNFINEGATNRYNSDMLRITAYIAWALGNTGYQGPAVEKARQFVEGRMGGKIDAYTLAVLANFAVDYGKSRELTARTMQMLLDARTEKDEMAWWTSEETGVYATGASASVETTGLAVQALLKWGEASGTAGKALKYIAGKKDASGTWGTTQATIMALRAVLLSTEKGAADVRGTLEVSLNGKAMEKVTLAPENNDLLHQFVFKGADAKAANTVSIRFAGKGGLAYQVVGQYFVPWNDRPAGEALSIGVAYDRTRLAQDDIATVTATVKNNLAKSANMVMVDLGIPPGFDLLSEDLQDFQDKTAGRKGGRLEKFSMTATQAILYFDAIGAGDTVTMTYRLRAKYPIKARTLQSRVYEYYDPAVSAVARPVELEVRKK